MHAPRITRGARGHFFSRCVHALEIRDLFKQLFSVALRAGVNRRD